jgi:hypothetical protein
LVLLDGGHLIDELGSTPLAKQAQQYAGAAIYVIWNAELSGDCESQVVTNDDDITTSSSTR